MNPLRAITPSDQHFGGSPYDHPDEPEPDRDAQRRRELEDGRDRFEEQENQTDL